MGCELCGHPTTQKHRITPGVWGGKYVPENVVRLCPNHHSGIHLLMRWYASPSKIKTQEDCDRVEASLMDDRLAALWTDRVKPIVSGHLKDASRLASRCDRAGRRRVCLVGVIHMGTHPEPMPGGLIRPSQKFAFVFEVPGDRPLFVASEQWAGFSTNDPIRRFVEEGFGMRFENNQTFAIRHLLGRWCSLGVVGDDWSRSDIADIANVKPLVGLGSGGRPSVDPFDYTVLSEEDPPSYDWLPLIDGHSIAKICRDSREWFNARFRVSADGN